MKNRSIPANDGHFSAEGMEPDLCHLVTPISPDEEAWLAAQLELVRSLAADEEPPDAPLAPAGAPIVFLDLDDVVCLCDPVGGLDALDCVMAKRVDVQLVYRHLFHPPAIAVLREMHVQMGGQLRYVISSTWREHFTRAQLRHVMRQAGLKFVADGMEDRARWATPRFLQPHRHREVSAWLGAHHAGEPFVVIDDEWSGPSLVGLPAYPLRVVLCEQSVGLQSKHLDGLLNALRTPPGQYETTRSVTQLNDITLN